MRADPGPGVVAYVAAAPEVDAARRAALSPLAEQASAMRPSVLLATCHRVEVFGEEDPPGSDRLISAGMTALHGVDAVRHVIELGIGLRSAVLAEDQLLHQLRTAASAARHRQRLGVDLDRAIDAALRAGRLARSWRPGGAGRPARSLADAALAIAAVRLGGVRDRTVLVVGAGKMGAAAALAARDAGARSVVASPTADHARELGKRVGAEVWPLDPGPRMDAIDVVVVALGGPWALGPDTARRVAARPVVIDLSMPPALAGPVADSLGDRLVGIDALATAEAGASAAHDRYRQRLVQLAERTLDGYLAGRDRVEGPASLADRVEQQRRAELAAFLRDRPDLDEAARAELDAVSRAVAARLFRDPLARLAHDPDGHRRRAAEELFG